MRSVIRSTDLVLISNKKKMLTCPFSIVMAKYGNIYRLALVFPIISWLEVVGWYGHLQW